MNDMAWSFYIDVPNANPILLNPLQWKGGNQIDNLISILTFFKKYYVPDKIKILIYRSMCGSGKSATLLHVIGNMGRGIIVTPFKNLQRQYYDDYYRGNKFVLKKDGTKLRVAVILGRNNFPCRWLAEQYDYQQRLIEESKKPENVDKCVSIDDEILNIYKYDPSCANKMLPCNRPLKVIGRTRKEARWVVASRCPYWTPTPLPKTLIDQWQEKTSDEKDIDEEFCNDIDVVNISEAKKDFLKADKQSNKQANKQAKTHLDYIKEKIKCSKIEYYKSVEWGETGIFIRDEYDKDGNKCPDVCPYYGQFYSYIFSDVIVMNSAKWYLETMIGRKPITNMEIFDEGDYWLDNQAVEIEFLRSSIDRIIPIDNRTQRMKKDTLALFDLTFRDIKSKSEEQMKTKNISIVDASTYKNLFINLQSTLNEFKKYMDDNDAIDKKLVDIATVIKYADRASISYKEGKRDETKIIKVFIPYPDKLLKELFDKSSKNIILTSGTIHTNFVLSNLFGINNDNYIVELIYGRKESPGKLRCIKPKDGLLKVTHTAWQSPQFREYYYKRLNYILDNLKIHIDKITNKPGEGKIIVLTPAKKYTEGIENRIDVFIDFARGIQDEDDIRKMINTNLSDYMSNTLEDVRKIKPADIQLDGDVLRTNQQIIISTRMIRGVDLKDDKCRAVVMTKWPISDISAGYNQALRKRFGDNTFWRIMHDKAEREAIQYVCRGLRHELDWEYFSSPDSMAFDNVFRLFTYD